MPMQGSITCSESTISGLVYRAYLILIEVEHINVAGHMPISSHTPFWLHMPQLRYCACIVLILSKVFQPRKVPTLSYIFMFLKHSSHTCSQTSVFSKTGALGGDILKILHQIWRNFQRWLKSENRCWYEFGSWNLNKNCCRLKFRPILNLWFDRQRMRNFWKMQVLAHSGHRIRYGVTPRIWCIFHRARERDGGVVQYTICIPKQEQSNPTFDLNTPFEYI